MDLATAKHTGQLQRRKSQSAKPENRDGLTRFQACLIQSVLRGCRRAHHDGAHFEWNLLGKRNRIRTWNSDEFRVTAVTMFADHLAAPAELFQAAHTELATSAVYQIMYANAVSR